jgi:hypothetical protein
VPRGRLQRSGHAHPDGEAARLPLRLQGPRHRERRPRHGQDDGPGTVVTRIGDKHDHRFGGNFLMHSAGAY